MRSPTPAKTETVSLALTMTTYGPNKFGQKDSLADTRAAKESKLTPSD